MSRAVAVGAAEAPGVAAAPLRGWSRSVHEVHVWGTVVVLDVRGSHLRPAALAVAHGEVERWLHHVDDVFSTWRPETPASLLRAGALDEAGAPALLRDALARCRAIRELTGGAFDPWSVAGGADLSGWVKGWAAGVAADILGAHGFADVSVNAAGDVVCRGSQSPGEPWAIGVVDPRSRSRVVAVAHVQDAAIATSGLYERGAHVIDPRTGLPASGADSATVVGPDAGLADALATALLVAGLAGVRWFRALPGWSVLLVRGDEAVSSGPAFEA